jgi:PPOX class probable FMN-dependent enzyme
MLAAMHDLPDEAALRAHFGPMSALVAAKALPRLDRFCRGFIALSPFLVLATADGAGGVDASPRGDAPGFVAVESDTALLIPDRPGNRRIDSFRNIVASPGIGLLFFVPGINESLRVNGSGEIVTDAALLAPLAAHGKIPATGLRVHVTEAFFHCGKAAIRAGLWDAARQVPRGAFPSLGRVVAEQTRVIAAEEAEAAIETSYRERLY